MSIKIDQLRCIGCGSCVEACPGNLIRLGETGRAAIRIPEDCWGCTSCVKVCPKAAISYFLGADIGGNGARMRVREHGFIYDWEIVFPDGKKTVLTVNRKNANQY